jgi:hypothetical protein
MVHVGTTHPNKDERLDEVFMNLGLPGRQKTAVTIAEFYSASPEPPPLRKEANSVGECLRMLQCIWKNKVIEFHAQVIIYSKTV